MASAVPQAALELGWDGHKSTHPQVKRQAFIPPTYVSLQGLCLREGQELGRGDSAERSATSTLQLGQWVPDPKEGSGRPPRQPLGL